MKLDRVRTAPRSLPVRAVYCRGALKNRESPIPNSGPSATNGLLARLRRDDDQAWVQRLEQVCLPKGTTLYEIGDAVGHAYFPLSGLVSLMSMTEEGETIEVAIVGREGMIGLPIVMEVDRAPSSVRVLTSTNVLRVRAEALRREFKRGGALHDVLLRYLHGVLSHISQAALCHRFHTVHQRFCRWLLAAQDRLGSDPLELTHECIAHLIGSPRTSVTAAALALQDAGSSTVATARSSS